MELLITTLSVLGIFSTIALGALTAYVISQERKSANFNRL